MVFGRFRGSGKDGKDGNDEKAADLAMQIRNEEGDEETATEVRPHRATELIGGSGISLDGQSLVLPQDRMPMRGNPVIIQPHDYDDVSSINTSVYGGASRHTMRIAAQADHARAPGFGLSAFDMENRSALNPSTAGTRGGSSSRGAMTSMGRSRVSSNTSHLGKSRHTDDDTLNRTAPNEISLDDDNSNRKAAFAAESSGCIPEWIYNAPGWVKCLIVVSAALLVSAMTLIGFGIARIREDSNIRATSFEQDNFGDAPPTRAPIIFVPDTAAPNVSTTSEPTVAPNASTTSEPTPAPTATPTRSPTAGNMEATGAPGSTTASPTAMPSLQPGDSSTSSPTETIVTTAEPTILPTMSPTTQHVTFFVTAGRFSGAALDGLPDNLRSLPNYDGQTVMFHLGDWNSPSATQCVESSYTDIVDVYKTSSVPVYFVPGDNEYNDCPNVTEAFEYWGTYIEDFETDHFPAPSHWQIERQAPFHEENFAYVYNRVLFLGINLVGGLVHDANEWQQRHRANLNWIDGQYQVKQNDFDYMVILAHADPRIQTNRDFFDVLFPRVKSNYTSKEVIFVHRNLGGQPWLNQPSYNDIPNLRVIVAKGSVWPPMRVQVDPATDRVAVDQDTWNFN